MPTHTSKRAQRRSRMRISDSSFLAPLLCGAFFIALWWWLTAATGIESWRLPSPGDVWERLVVLCGRPATWAAAGTTIHEALVGSCAAIVCAVSLSYAIYRVPWLAAALEPFLGATQALPAIAVAPLLVLWLGYGKLAIAVLCALIVFFPILVASLLGLRHLDREILEAAQLDGASSWRMALSIEIPLAAPAILAGIRNGLTLSVTGAIVGEMVMGGRGLGQMLVQMRTNIDTAGMFAVIVLLCAMAVIVHVVCAAIERRVAEHVQAR